MGFLRAKWVIGAVVVLVLIGGGIFALVHKSAPTPLPPKPVVVTQPTWPTKTEVVGTSTEGRAITAYTYGTGATHLLFVGGMHGGYEWNSVLLAYQFMDYLKANPAVVPANLSVTVIPSANPDGVYKVTGVEGRFTVANVSTNSAVLAAGRFNAHNVDLNRNFDCNWQATSTWQSKIESAGTAAFSEPEAKAIQRAVLEEKPSAVVFWHSQSGAVYASECHEGILPGTLTLMNTYAKAAGYAAVDTFDAYAITGDSEGWLASIHIPAVTVELKTHNFVEFNQNLAGIKAMLTLYSQGAPK